MLHSLKYKRISLLLAGLLIMLALKANGQTEKIVFPYARTTVGQAINTIEDQTQYVFSYESRLLDTEADVVFPTLEMPVTEAVAELLKDKDLSYMVRNKYIIIYPQTTRQVKEIRRTEDIYTPTPIDSLNVFPLKRPSDSGEGKDTGHQNSESEVIKEPEPPIFYSSYIPPEQYMFPPERLPSLLVKTNLLYAGVTLTPNLAVETGLSPKTSLEISGSYNPWNRVGTLDDNKKLVHWTVRAEYRYWLCERFSGHFFGGNLFYTQYNISGHKIPFVNFKKGFRYEGNAYGAGIKYGYHLALGKRWGVEFSAGIGFAYVKYDRFECSLCSGALDSPSKVYFGPTNAGISLVFLIK